LLSVLAHFFEHDRWDSPVEMGVEGQSLTEEDQLFILTQAGLYLTATRGLGAPEAQICYERAQPLCHSLNRPLLLYVALMGQWRYSLMTDKLSATIEVAKRVYSLAQEQNDSAQMVGAYRALAGTLFFSGDFESARQYAMRGVQIWRSGGVESHPEFFDAPVAVCLCYQALSQWHLGEIESCQATIAEAISLAEELNDMLGLAAALNFAGYAAHYERNPAEMERFASVLIELSTRQNFAYWTATGAIFRGWARSASGDTANGILWIEDAIEDFRSTGSTLAVPFWLSLKAEALYLADRTFDALEAIMEAEKVAVKSEEQEWSAELHRLRGVFLAALGAGQTQIDASFREAIRIARKQKSVSLEKRAKGTHAEYRRQKAGASGGHGFRLPLW
jgi:tetratricopeptide (TPR) repeat protein